MSVGYDQLSLVYDQLLYDMPGSEWADYLAGLLPDGPLRLLEYACGSGRLTQEFLARGHAVIGVDRAEGMLAQAAEKLRPLGRPFQLACADMAQFRLVAPMDAAVCGLDGVNYLTTEDDLKAFFAGAAANLAEDATFVFDISSPWRLEHVIGNDFFYDDGDDQTLFWQNSFDADRRLLEMSLTVFNRDGNRYRRIDELHVVRAWSEDEIRAALTEAGFRNVEVFAFGTREPPTEKSERIVFRARKGAPAAGV